jgi:hypothetical protein
MWQQADLHNYVCRRLGSTFEMNLKLNLSDYHWNLLHNRQPYPRAQQ